MNFLIRIISNALAIYVATLLVSDIYVFTKDDWQSKVLTFVTISLVFTLVNMFVRPVIKFFSLPFYVLTLGGFFLIVNAIMLKITDFVTAQVGAHLEVRTFIAAILGGIVISLVNTSLELILPKLDL